MKKIIITLAVTIVSICVLSSCKPKEERVIDRLNNLSEKIEKHGESWDADDWADALEELQDIHADIEECDFSKEQLRKLGNVEGKLMGVIMTEGAKSLQSTTESFFEGAGSELKGFKSGLQDSYDTASLEDLDEQVTSQLEELEKELKD